MSRSDSLRIFPEHGLTMRLFRRLWWATLPHWGWVSVTADEIADGANPCPWWAHPLAWVHVLLDKTVFRRRDTFGPLHRQYVPYRVPKPWK